MAYNLKPILKRKSLTTQNSIKEKKSVVWFGSVPTAEDRLTTATTSSDEADADGSRKV